jgi:hypothetical protein
MMIYPTERGYMPLLAPDFPAKPYLHTQDISRGLSCFFTSVKGRAGIDRPLALLYLPSLVQKPAVFDAGGVA